MFLRKKYFLFLLVFIGFVSAQKTDTVKEYSVLPLPLQGKLAEKSSEISGLAWYGDRLIILPQYPERENNNLFSLSRRAIEEWINNVDQIPLVSDGVSVDFNQMRVRGISIPQTELIPALIKVDYNGIFEKINGYEGFESIGFIKDQAYLTIECKDAESTFAYLVRGTMTSNGSKLSLDATSVCKILPQAPLHNFSEEALVCYKDKVYTFYEANGKNVNPQPIVHYFTSGLKPLGSIPFTTLEYRITDATAADKQGRFWVMNYFWPQERAKLRPAADTLIERYGRGKTHQANHAVERLVEFQITKDKIILTGKPPVQIKLLSNDSRNWEGLVRLPGKGFLLATDRFPETILAFIPFPEQ